jgi:hypothetical protein
MVELAAAVALEALLQPEAEAAAARELSLLRLVDSHIQAAVFQPTGVMAPQEMRLEAVAEAALEAVVVSYSFRAMIRQQ